MGIRSRVSGWLRGVRDRLGDADEAAPAVEASTREAPTAEPDGLAPEDVTIDADRLAWLIDTDDVAVLDARGSREGGGVPNSVAWTPGAPVPGDRVVVVVDEHGASAPGLALRLRGEGIEAWALGGGVRAWRRAGHALAEPTS